MHMLPMTPAEPGNTGNERDVRRSSEQSRFEGGAPQGEHTVLFYDTDHQLIDALCRYVANGLEYGESCVIIATRAHRAFLKRRLQVGGFDIATLRQERRFIDLDADTLSQSFMVEGIPDTLRFRQALTRVLARATSDGRHARLFGEMVANLWTGGNQAAAVQLEALWNNLQRATTPFTLLCAYPAWALANEADRDTLRQPHARVVRLAGVATHVSSRRRVISHPLREARVAQVEEERQKLAEERARFAEQRYRQLFTACLDGVLMLDAQTGQVSEANPAALNLLGLTLDQVLSHELWQIGLFSGPESVTQMMRALRKQSQVRYEALPLQSAAGETRMVEFVASRIAAEGAAAGDRRFFIQCLFRDGDDRPRLSDEIVARARELEAIQSITDVALAQSSLDDLVREMLERLRAVLNVDNTAILLPDETGRTLRIYLARGPEEEVAGQVRVPIGEGFAGTIAATRQPMVVSDIRAIPVANPFLHERFQSMMGAPLLVGDRLIGVIHAGTEQKHRFTAREVRMLQLVAERIALAIERAQLHQEAQEARQEATERALQLQATFEAITDGVVVYDQSGRLSMINLAAQRLLGFNTSPLEESAPLLNEGHMARDAQGRLLPPAELPISRVLRGEVITGANTADLFVRVNGHDIELGVSGAPVRDSSGAVRGGVCVFRDVTAQRRLERRTHAALTALLAMAMTLVDLPAADAPLENVDSSEAPVAQRLAELAQGVLGAQRVAILVIEPESQALRPVAVAGLSTEAERQQWAEWSAQQHRYGAGTDPQLLARIEAGEVITLDLSPSAPIARGNADGAALVTAMRIGAQVMGILAFDFDNASRKFTEQESGLAQAVAQLVALVIERDRNLREREEARASALAAQETTRRMHTFVGIAGHELRTPVTSLKMSVQLAARALRQINDDIAQEDRARFLTRAQSLLQRADQESNRLNRLIEDVLDVTRIQEGRLELRVELTDLAEITRHVVIEQRLLWADREITLHTPPAPVVLTLDADRIEQVIVNFITNALKYSASDQPVLVEVTTTPDIARVEVTDRGPGISPQAQATIWEPFHQAPGIHQRSGSSVGLGLGLYVSRMLVERHGGQIGVESKPGAGSTFWFELPLYPEQPPM